MIKKCSICGGGKLERKLALQTFTYKSKKLRYEQPGLYCSKCKEAILDNSDMEAVETILFDFRAKVDGYLTTGEIRRVRKKLSLTQKEAAEIFGGGHNAFSRYESGLVRPPKSTDSLLRLLDKRPELLSEIPSKIAA
jgi:HTH-type transcriptional regulator/antitoxin MqsA